MWKPVNSVSGWNDNLKILGIKSDQKHVFDRSTCLNVYRFIRCMTVLFYLELFVVDRPCICGHLYVREIYRACCVTKNSCLQHFVKLDSQESTYLGGHLVQTGI